MSEHQRFPHRTRLLPLFAAAVSLACAGCHHLVRTTDRDVATLIEQRQREAEGYRASAALGDAEEPPPRPDATAYERSPNPRTKQLPEGFDASAERTERENDADAVPDDLTEAATTQPTRFRDEVFTLTDALAYAQQHRRGYQNAKEDLYLSALALTLERHLWTPQFAASLRGVYGNFGEVTDFDQATRFVADLSVAQRLPYGGEFTAAAVSTLIRDVGRNVTATEGSSITLGLDIPLLRGAGHVAQEDLIQLERELTYAVRSFERFRRRQLVTVAQQYFSLLASKQVVFDARSSLESAKRDLDRANDRFEAGYDTVLETGRAKTRVLQQQNSLARSREAFRAAVDQFKIAIGMPMEEAIGLDDLETIEAIEQQIENGRYPLLRMSPAAKDEAHATGIATQYRLDLLTVRDRIDDAKRGVAIAENTLLPDLDWTSSLQYDTDPEHYRLGAFEQARATWRTELLLSINDRFRERNNYRAALIDVHRARRDATEQTDRIRAEVLSAINQIQLQEQLVSIQQRVVEVADERRRYARTMVEQGKLGNRDLIEAEDEHVAALNSLNRAKTDRWSALLGFRLATGTLHVGDDGVQHDNPALPQPARVPSED